MITQKRKFITVNELKEWIAAEKEFILLDVLPGEYYLQKHIPEAKNACVYEVVFADKVNEIASSKETAIVVYGENAGYLASAFAVTKLQAAGYTNIYELEGGIDEWEKAGNKLIKSDSAITGAYCEPDWHKSKQQLKVSTEKSWIKWTGRNIGNLHWGAIKLKQGELKVDNGRITGGNFAINMDSIQCDDITDSDLNKLLVWHLKNPDFFDTETYPEAHFRISAVKDISDATPGKPNIEIAGELTIKGISNEINFQAVTGWNSDGVLFAQAVLDIDRTRWKVMYGSGRFFERLGMHLVNDLISLQLYIVAE